MTGHSLSDAVTTDRSVADHGGTRTQELAAWLAQRRPDDMPGDVAHEACRAILDTLGCMYAGSRHPSIQLLTGVLARISPAPLAPVLGHDLRLGPADAALANGQMAHVLDFDDTLIWQTNVIHTSAPVLAALLALAGGRELSGPGLLLAYASGFDAGAAVAAAARGHIGLGFHGTGTLGGLAAGAAVARLLDLDPLRFNRALAISATQAAGLQQNRGTMCKSFHAGKAAGNAVLAGLLAEAGFSSSLEILEGKLGFLNLLSAEPVAQALTDHVQADSWALLQNGYKPYACGFVLHPAIDGVIALRNTHAVTPDAVQTIRITGHEHILSVTGLREPVTGLQSKFSIYHSAAVALIDGAAGLAQYADARAVAPEVSAMRRKIEVRTDPAFGKGEAVVEVQLAHQKLTQHVKAASGTSKNPMSDLDIEAKFTANAAPVLGEARASALVEAVWALPGAQRSAAFLSLL